MEMPNKSIMDEIKPIELKLVEVNGTALPYVELGRGEPVVLVHGVLSDYRMWEGQMEPFSQKYRVIAYSRRYAWPVAGGDDSVGYTVVAHARDLAAFLQALDPGPVHLVGHSYGAYIALLTAMDHPELVKTLVLCEAAVYSLLKDSDEGLSLLTAFEANTFLPFCQAFDRGEDLRGAQIFLDGVMGVPDFYARLNAEAQGQVNDNLWEMKGIATAKTIFPFFPATTCMDLTQVQAPVLLVSGALSPRFLQLITEELAKCLIHSERMFVPDASHEMEYDNPSAFNEAILRFLDQYSN